MKEELPADDEGPRGAWYTLFLAVALVILFIALVLWVSIG